MLGTPEHGATGPTARLVALICLLGSQGCRPNQSPPGATEKTLAQLSAEITVLKRDVDALRAEIGPAERIRYSARDIARNKEVATFLSFARPQKGDRIFVADDMWDVRYTKLFILPAGCVPPPPSGLAWEEARDAASTCSVRQVELLVSFAGKASDRKEK